MPKNTAGIETEQKAKLGDEPPAGHGTAQEARGDGGAKASAPVQKRTDELSLLHLEAPYFQAFRMGLGAAFLNPAASKDLNVADIGVGRGRTLALLCALASALPTPLRITGIDSFDAGSPVSDKDEELNATNPAFWQRLYPESTLREVEAFLEPLKNNALVDLYAGDAGERLAELPERKYFFAHISSIRYPPHVDALKYLYPRLIPGGVILIDHYHSKQYPSSKAATDDFLADLGEPLFMLQSTLGAIAFRKAMLVRTG